MQVGWGAGGVQRGGGGVGRRRRTAASSQQGGAAAVAPAGGHGARVPGRQRRQRRSHAAQAQHAACMPAAPAPLDCYGNGDAAVGPDGQLPLQTEQQEGGRHSCTQSRRQNSNPSLHRSSGCFPAHQTQPLPQAAARAQPTWRVWGGAVAWRATAAAPLISTPPAPTNGRLVPARRMAKSSAATSTCSFSICRQGKGRPGWAGAGLRLCCVVD